MGTTINFIGTNYTIPAVGEIGWGQDVTNYLLAISTGVLDRSGGSFILTSNVDFGPSFGLETAFIQSRQSNPATAGIARLANSDSIQWRNAANNANLVLDVNSSSNRLEFQGSALVDVSTSQTLFNKTLSSANLLNPTITGGTISGLTVSSLTGLDVDGNTHLGDNSSDTLTVDATSTFNAPVTVGSTLQVSGASTFNDDITVNGNTVLDGTLTVSSTATFNGTTTLNDDLTVNGNTTLDGTLQVSGASTLNDDLTVTGNTTLDGTLQVSGASTLNDDLTVNGNTTLNGTLTVSGASTLNDDLTVNGTLLIEDGTVSSPSLGFVSDTNTGIYRVGSI
jgi:cytoskeletal protein CcmA (bactofilin family)